MLNRMLFAELKRMWGQAMAICAVLACGVTTMVMSTSTTRSLEITCDAYYRDYRFADLFLSLKRAPQALGDRLREIPGVERVETRVVRDVVLDVPGMVEAASCRLLSLSADPKSSLNGVHLRRGRMPDPNRRGEVLASEVFAEAHGLTPGDSVAVIMDGREERLRIVGLGMSPEYVYSLPPGQMLPDNRHFGVLWMPYRQMAAAFNMEGAFNDAAILLTARASTKDVIERIDLLTDPHGGLGAYERDEQASHRRVADEIQQVKSMALVWPVIFLAVTAFLFNLVFSRLVRQQQEEIATLRAFGYGPFEIGWHYIKMLLLLVLAGVLVGAVAGVWLAQQMVTMYGQFFRFPEFLYVIAWDEIPVATALSIACGILGGFAAIRRAMRLPPAVAMRPEAPATYRKSLVELIGLSPFMTTVSIMVVRRLERNLVATGLSILGMALGVGVLVMGSFTEDTIHYVIDVQFSRSQRQDVTITFAESISAAAIHDAARLPGVQNVEPFRAAPARFRNGQRTYRVGVMGLEPNPQLFRVLDEDYHPVTIARGGLTISQKLAELLDVQVGELIDIQFLHGRRLRRAAPVTAIFRDYSEPAAYMTRQDLHRLLQEGESHSGAFLDVNEDRIQDLHASLKKTPAVAAVTVKKAALESFEELFSQNLAPMRIMYALFASIISFGVIFNCALITLAERSRDLATLRVLGFTRQEVSRVLLGELGAITLASIPIGLPIGYGFAALAVVALDTETHRFPLVVSNATYAYATTVTLIAALFSALTVRHLIDKLDLIAVLKVKE